MQECVWEASFPNHEYCAIQHATNRGYGCHANEIETHIEWVGTRGGGRRGRSYDVRMLTYLTLPVISLQTLDYATHTRVGEYRKLACADAVIETQVRKLLGCHAIHGAHRARLVHIVHGHRIDV